MDKQTRDFLESNFRALNEKIDLKVNPLMQKACANEKRSIANSNKISIIYGGIATIVFFVGLIGFKIYIK